MYFAFAAKRQTQNTRLLYYLYICGPYLIQRSLLECFSMWELRYVLSAGCDVDMVPCMSLYVGHTLVQIPFATALDYWAREGANTTYNVRGTLPWIMALVRVVCTLSPGTKWIQALGTDTVTKMSWNLTLRAGACTYTPTASCYTLILYQDKSSFPKSALSVCTYLSRWLGVG